MKYNKVIGSFNIKLDTKRMDNNLRNAQNVLDDQVVNDMRKYTPMQQGDLRSKTQIKEPGLITVDTLYAHYQYVGELYLTADGRSWANRGEKKYPTGTELKYHTPGTGKRWFETAKENHGKQWIDLVKREVGKG